VRVLTGLAFKNKRNFRPDYTDTLQGRGTENRSGPPIINFEGCPNGNVTTGCNHSPH
jgi:hypothetical protein